MKPNFASQTESATPKAKKRLFHRQDQWLNRMGLRGRIFVFLLLFVVILLIVLWLMQIVYLNDFYERIKTEQINSAGDSIATALQNGLSEAEDGQQDLHELEDLVYDLAQRRQICASVYLVRSPAFFMATTEQLLHADVLADCVIHHISSTNLALFYTYAQGQGGIYTERFTRTIFLPGRDENEVPVVAERASLWDRFANPQEGGLPDSLVYARTVVSESGKTYFVLLNSSITPVTATVATLRQQLLLVSIFLILLALVLSTIIARHLSLPIYQINRQAKLLAKGDFNQSFDVEGYREIGELANTLHYASVELAKSGKLQQEIVANISHDLRTPLTMIGGYAEFMRDFPEEDHSESIGVIIEETERLSALVKDVLDESRLNAGVETMQPEEFDLTQALAELVTHYGTLTEKDGYQLQFEATAQVFVEADRPKLMQAVGNMLSNAIAHAGADKLVLVRQLIVGETVRVEVEDHGPGIDKNDQPHIWRRYYRADAPHRSSRGSGLGLSIVKGVLELHQADYGVESELGQGSIFWFALPYRTVQPWQQTE